MAIKITDEKINELGKKLKLEILKKADEVSKGNPQILLLNQLMITIGVVKNFLNIDEHISDIMEELQKKNKVK
jgi:hypothetical protein